MADVDVKALMLQVDASVLLAEKNLAKLSGTVERERAKMQADLTRLDKGFASLGKGIGTAKAVLAGFAGGIGSQLISQLPGTLIRMGKSALDAAGDIGELADSLGVSVEFLQRFHYAATQTGASTEAADAALAKFTKTAGSALNGNKEAVDSFKRLGISQADVAKHANDMPALFIKFAGAVARIKDPARQSADALALIGRGGTPLLALLKSGETGFNNLASAADKLGIVLSRDLIDRSDDIKDRMASLKTVVDAQMARAITDNADAFIALAKAMGEVAVAAAKLPSWAKDHPGQAGAVAGGVGGLIVGGLPGAVVGAAGGSLYGSTKGFEAKGREAQAKRRAALGPTNQEMALRIIQALPADTPIAKRLTADYKKKYGDLPSGKAASTGAPRTTPGVTDFTPVADGTADTAARKAAQERLERIRNSKDYARDTASAEAAMAELQARLSGTAEARLAIELARIESARKAQNEDLDYEGPGGTGKLSAARLANLKRLNNETAKLDATLVQRDYQLENDRTSVEVKRAGIEAEQLILSVQASTAKTAGERQALEMRLLELDKERERMTLEQVRNDPTASSRDRTLANTNLGSLDSRYGARAADVKAQNRGPGAQYLESLPSTIDQINEAIQGIEIDGLDSLNDGLTDAIMGVRSLGSVFKGIAKQIISDLIKIAIRKAIIGPIAGALFGGGGLGKLFGRATGGAVSAGQPYMVGEMGREVFVPKVGGDIVANNRVGQMGSNYGRGMTVEHVVTVTPSPLFDVAVSQRVGQGMAAGAEQFRQMNRPRMRGGRG